MSFLKHAALAACSLSVLAAPALADHIWINEFHYDDIDVDGREFVEVAVRSGPAFNAADYSVILYNGNNGATYDTDALNTFTASAAIPVIGSSETVTLHYLEYPSNGIQNGAPDGIAIVDTVNNSVVQFLSYEGVVTASDGIANGQMSTDMGLAESNATLELSSLGLTGLGDRAANFSWAAHPATGTPGAPNAGQVFGVIPEPAACGLALSGLVGVICARRRR